MLMAAGPPSNSVRRASAGASCARHVPIPGFTGRNRFRISRYCTDAFTWFMRQRTSPLFMHQFYQSPAVASVWIDALERRAFGRNRCVPLHLFVFASDLSEKRLPSPSSRGHVFRSDALNIAIRCCMVHEPKLLVKIFKIFNAIACVRPPGPLGKARTRPPERRTTPFAGCAHVSGIRCVALTLCSYASL